MEDMDVTNAYESDGAELNPLVQAAKSETAFLLRPSSETAMQLLISYHDEHMIFNIFTPHWAYKAGALLLSDPSQDASQEGYVLAVTVLDRCALKWPNSRALQDMLKASAKATVKSTSNQAR